MNSEYAALLLCILVVFLLEYYGLIEHTGDNLLGLLPRLRCHVLGFCVHADSVGLRSFELKSVLELLEAFTVLRRHVTLVEFYVLVYEFD